ncbi:MAG: glycosyl hydrolase family 28-related protein [Pseudomonadota bacterium]
MNKAITDGIILMPPPFESGLDQWSALDGRPGDPTYATDPRGTLVPDDADFGACLELQRDGSTQLRYTGETPIFPGCYLKVSTRVKLVGGPRPSVAMAGFPGDAGGSQVSGVSRRGPAVFLENYGEIYEVSMIVGSGDRTGVDLVWGVDAVFGHFGLDILSSNGNGALVRIESIRIDDVTSIFHRKMMDWVDVRDFGAIGDGVTDDKDAFDAADVAADGRQVLVSAGTYFVDRNLTMSSRTRFEGTMVMPQNARLALTGDFSFNHYVDAFGDETVALEKALQALMNFSDHESLDLGGRRIQLTRPIDVRAAVNNQSTFSNRRVLRNGQLEALDSPDWNDTVVNSTATYNTSNEDYLTNVANIANIPVGARIIGNGVGREVYAREVDVAGGRIRLSQPLWGVAANQSYEFRRHKYILDFSGFNVLQRFNIEDVEFACLGRSSGIMLPPDGIAWSIRDCWFLRPKNRGITSIGEGCNGLQIDRNHFISNESQELVQNRRTVAFNTNKNDLKIRNNRAVQFLHFGVMAGGGHIVSGNHFFQGDDATNGQRSAGLVMASRNTKSSFTGNYVDNAWVEFSNEYDHTPDATAGSKPFGTMSITSNVFTAGDVPDNFTYIRFAPYGSNHPIDGVVVQGNTFKTIGNSTLDRVESIDTSRGTIVHGATKNMTFSGNAYEEVRFRTESPAYVAVTRSSPTTVWTLALDDKLPFNGRALGVDGVSAIGAITNGSGQPVYEMPHVLTEQGTNGDQISLRWSTPVRGTVYLRVRSDIPS